MGENQVQSLVLSQAGQHLLPQELFKFECVSGSSHLFMRNSCFFINTEEGEPSSAPSLSLWLM